MKNDCIRFLYIYNSFNRERFIIDTIERKLRDLDSTIVFEKCDVQNSYSVIKLFSPNIVFTYPITTKIQIAPYMYAKVVKKSLIITFTTEGYCAINDKNLASLAGLYKYDSKLIDYHFFWGKLIANELGKRLYKQKKITDLTRIKVFGNPMYEIIEVRKDYVYNDAYEIIRGFKGKRVLVLSGFHFSEYTKADLINAGDICREGDEKTLDRVFNRVLNYRNYRNQYFNSIENAIKKHKDTLFIVKPHPQELHFIPIWKDRFEYLTKLPQYKNVLLLKEQMPIGQLLSNVDLMISYGSTSDLEAYIYGVPCKVIAHKDQIINGMAFLDEDDLIKVDQKCHLDEVIADLNNNKISFKRNKKIEQLLRDYMNYNYDEDYSPSLEMASFIISHRFERQRIRNPFLIAKVVFWTIFQEVRIKRRKLRMIVSRLGK